MHSKVSQKWAWIVCTFTLKQNINGEENIWNLAPAIALQHPNGTDPDPNVKLNIDTEKSLQHSDNLGWNWHKSWNLPSINLQMDIRDVKNGEALLCPKHLYAHIFAVKAMIDNSNKLYLVDVGLRGNNKLELVDGKASFQTLKFASTSYNNEGVKFHLLICIYIQESEKSKPKILKSFVSPPIFVDSRKSVRDAQKLNESKLHLYIDPFYPDNFTKKFTKRETKKKESIEEDIQNNIEGLYSYLTAPNIRHKVKHPIFLCVRFSNCISLYHNANELSEENKKNFVEYMQNLLYDDLDKLLTTKENKIEESIFLMFINKEQLQCKTKKKKILELLIPVKSKSLSVVFSSDEIPPNFIKLTNLTEIMDLYTRSYAKLIARSKLFNKDFEEDEDGPEDDDNQAEHQVIDIAHNDPSTSNTCNNALDHADFFGTMIVDPGATKKIKSDNTNQELPTIHSMQPLTSNTNTLNNQGNKSSSAMDYGNSNLNTNQQPPQLTTGPKSPPKNLPINLNSNNNTNTSNNSNTNMNNNLNHNTNNTNNIANNNVGSNNNNNSNPEISNHFAKLTPEPKTSLSNKQQVTNDFNPQNIILPQFQNNMMNQPPPLQNSELLSLLNSSMPHHHLMLNQNIPNIRKDLISNQSNSGINNLMMMNMLNNTGNTMPNQGMNSASQMLQGLFNQIGNTNPSMNSLGNNMTGSNLTNLASLGNTQISNNQDQKLQMFLMLNKLQQSNPQNQQRDNNQLLQSLLTQMKDKQNSTNLTQQNFQNTGSPLNLPQGLVTNPNALGNNKLPGLSAFNPNLLGGNFQMPIGHSNISNASFNNVSSQLLSSLLANSNNNSLSQQQQQAIDHNKLLLNLNNPGGILNFTTGGLNLRKEKSGNNNSNNLNNSNLNNDMPVKYEDGGIDPSGQNFTTKSEVN